MQFWKLSGGEELARSYNINKTMQRGLKIYDVGGNHFDSDGTWFGVCG